MFGLVCLKRHRPCPRSRKGAMLVLVAVALVILLAAAAFSVDVAYMHLVREELRIATDAAAKAAVTKLSLGGTEDEARSLAVTIASKNRVAGKALTIDAANVQLGCSTYATGSRWAFTKDATPLTAASVTVNMAGNTTPGTVNLFFGRLFGTSTFSPTRTSTAAFVRNKVCLCFDRSRSMTFDLSGINERWPTSSSGWPTGVPSSAGAVKIGKTTYDFRWLYPPCNNSRWYHLANGANTFLDVLDELRASNAMVTQVALLTWGSSYDNSNSKDVNNKYHTYTGRTLNTSSSRTTFTAYDTNASFVTTYATIRSTIAAKKGVTMLGGTDMNAGLQEAVDLFESTKDGLRWNKIIILFSDGCYTTTNPVNSAAVSAANADIIVHTVGFLLNNEDSSIGEPTLKGIANATGGRYFKATDGASLKKSFEDLARTLPVILTQ